MKKEFMVERQGKQFVLYAGLVDAATAQGLTNIRTEIAQIPHAENGEMAIVTALVTLEQGGVVRSFTGIGDAAPNNVSPAMRNCLLRMAETRAKARALRDALNIGVCSAEEMSDDAAPSPQSAAKREFAPRGPVGRQSLRQATPSNQCGECFGPDGKHTPACSKRGAKVAA